MRIIVTEDQFNKLKGDLKEKSRSFAFTRKKRLFPKSAMMSNPLRFKKFDKEIKDVD